MNDNQNLTEIPQTPKKPLPFHRIYNAHLVSEVARITTTKTTLWRKVLKSIMVVSAGVLLGAVLLFFLMTTAGYKNDMLMIISFFPMMIALPVIMDKQDVNLRAILIIGFFFINMMGIFLMIRLNEMGVSYAMTLYFSCAVSLFIGVIFFYYTYRKSLQDASQKHAGSFYEQYTNILKKLVEMFDENMTYKPNYGISKQVVIDSQLFYNEGKTYESYNLVERIGQPQFSFSYIRFGGDKKKSLKDMQDMEIPADGIFIIADIEKELQGITVIKPKSSIQSIAKDFVGAIWGSDDNKTLVDIEHDEFNKYFTVYSDYPLESMEILTPDFIECLMALQKKLLPDVLKKDNELHPNSNTFNFSISIQNKKIYIYPNLYQGKRVLKSVKMFKSTASKNSETIRKRLKKDYEYLQKIVEIVQELRID